LFYSNVAAVHVDTNGKSVVAMLSDSRLLVIPDIVELIRGDKKIEDSVMQVVLSCADHEPNFYLPPGGVYLAVENGKVGVITVYHSRDTYTTANGLCRLSQNFGIFILTLDPIHLGLINSKYENNEDNASMPSNDIYRSNLPFKRVRPCRLLPFSDWAPLNAINCLQMTPNKIYFAWSRHYLPRKEHDNDQTTIRKGSFDNEDLIIGYSPEGDRIAVSRTVLSELFRGQRPFEDVEDEDDEAMGSIRRLFDGAGGDFFLLLITIIC
jgi:hypothetical protein